MGVITQQATTSVSNGLFLHFQRFNIEACFFLVLWHIRFITLWAHFDCTFNYKKPLCFLLSDLQDSKSALPLGCPSLAVGFRDVSHQAMSACYYLIASFSSNGDYLRRKHTMWNLVNSWTTCLTFVSNGVVIHKEKHSCTSLTSAHPALKKMYKKVQLRK